MPCTSSSLANFSEKYYIWAAAEAEGSAPEDFYTNCHYDEHYYDQQHYYNQPGRFITECNALLVASYIGVECIGYKFPAMSKKERTFPRSGTRYFFEERNGNALHFLWPGK